MKLFVLSLAVALVATTACSDAAVPTELDVKAQFTVVQGGCPPPFSLIVFEDPPAEEAPPKPGEEVPVDPAVAADRNGDNIVCVMTDRQDEKTIRIWIDNNVPLSQIGKCPDSFVLTGAPGHQPGNVSADNNGDGLICTKTLNNGSSVVMDNNHRS